MTPDKFESRAREKLNYASFNQGVQFNLYGILNTPPDNSVYKVTAKLGTNCYDVDQIDWQNTTKKNFRFACQEFIATKDTFTPAENCFLLYEVSKYSLNSMTHEPDYAFAVHPLARTNKGQL